MKHKLSLILGLASTLAFAQQGGIGTVKVEPNPARAGQEVKITIAAEGEAPGFCGMVVHFDDGSESRNVKAEGRRITTHFPCVGTATAKLVVEPGPAAAAAAPTCPQGYKMVGRMGKAGDFSCKGGKGAMAPAKPLGCAMGLEYFANDKARQVGCRKLKAQKK